MGDAPTPTPDAPDGAPSAWEALPEAAQRPDSTTGAAAGAPPVAAEPAYHDAPLLPPPASQRAGAASALSPDRPHGAPAAPLAHPSRAVAGAGAPQPEAAGGGFQGDAAPTLDREAGGDGLYRSSGATAAAAAVPGDTGAQPMAAGARPELEGGSNALSVLSAIAGSFSEAVRFADLQAEAEAAAPAAGDAAAEGEGSAYPPGSASAAAGRGDTGGPVTSGDGLEGPGQRSRRRNVLNELHAEAQALEADIRRMQGLCTSSRYSGFRTLLEHTPEFPAALSQALQQLAHYSSRVRSILVSSPVDFRVASEACSECIATYCRIHQLRSRVYSQPHARSLLTGSHISSTHPALQALVGDMPLSQWMASFLSTDGASLAQQPFDNCRELLTRWRMHERQLEEQLETLQSTMRSSASESLSHLLQHSLQLAPDQEGNSVVVLRREGGTAADASQGDGGGGGGGGPAAGAPRGRASAAAATLAAEAAAAGGVATAGIGGGAAGERLAQLLPSVALPAQRMAAAAAQAPPPPLSPAMLAQCVQALRQNEEFRSVALQQLQALLPPADMLRFLAVRFEIEDACKHLVQHVEPQAPTATFLGGAGPPMASSGAAAVNLTQAKPGGPWPKPPTG